MTFCLIKSEEILVTNHFQWICACHIFTHHPPQPVKVHSPADHHFLCWVFTGCFYLFVSAQNAPAGVSLPFLCSCYFSALNDSFSTSHMTPLKNCFIWEAFPLLLILKLESILSPLNNHFSCEGACNAPDNGGGGGQEWGTGTDASTSKCIGTASVHWGSSPGT